MTRVSARFVHGTSSGQKRHVQKTERGCLPSSQGERERTRERENYGGQSQENSHSHPTGPGRRSVGAVAAAETVPSAP